MAARYHPNGLRVIDRELIGHVTRTIVDAFHPKRIVLFGSQARGDPGSDSDLDLMIEMETDMRHLDRMVAVGKLFPEETGRSMSWCTRQPKSRAAEMPSGRCCT